MLEAELKTEIETEIKKMKAETVIFSRGDFRSKNRLETENWNWNWNYENWNRKPSTENWKKLILYFQFFIPAVRAHFQQTDF